MTRPTYERLLRTGEVARIFRVAPRTVTRWAAEGKLPCIKTPFGHRRYRESEIAELLEVR